MGIYTEKREQLIKKIKELEKRISEDTERKKKAENKIKEVSRLAMAEEYNCKPRELDEIITSEHTLLQKLRASGLSDEDLLKLVGVRNADSDIMSDKKDDNSTDSDSHYYDNEDDDISFYDRSDND